MRTFLRGIWLTPPTNQIVVKNSHIINNGLHYLYLRRCKIIKLLLVFQFIIIFFSETLLAQSNQCIQEPIPNELEQQIGSPDCTLQSYDEICVRIKFHHINHTGGTTEAHDDAYYVNVLQEFNDILRPGKIRLTFDDNCVH
jgi:hypothetical protein